MMRELWWMIDIQNDGVQKSENLILLQRSKRWDKGLTVIVEQYSEYWFWPLILNMKKIPERIINGFEKICFCQKMQNLM